eukprot:2774890-Alexandrium_andersonii.AAC.1
MVNAATDQQSACLQTSQNVAVTVTKDGMELKGGEASRWGTWRFMSCIPKHHNGSITITTGVSDTWAIAHVRNVARATRQEREHLRIIKGYCV